MKNLRSPMKITVDEIFAAPENAVYDGPYIADQVAFSGFQSSDLGRPGNPSKYFQSFDGCPYSISSLRVVGLWNYFDEEDYNWIKCDSRGGMNENYQLTKSERFEVSFYKMDANGMPGECIFSKEYDVVGRYMGVTYGSGIDDMPLYEFLVELGEEVKLETGFMAFTAVDMGDEPTCWFSLFTADTSKGYGFVEMGSYGMMAANMPIIFSFMGDGSLAADKALKVSELTSPTKASTGTHEKVTVKVKNVGANDITDATLQLTVDGVDLDSEVIKQTIPSGGSYNYTFMQRVDLSGIGDHTVEVRNVTPGDEHISVDLATVSTYTYVDGETCDSGSKYEDDETYIAIVSMGDIDNMSGPGNYSDYTNEHQTTLRPGEKLTLTVEPMNVEYIGVWIDWNNDGTYDDEGELMGYIFDAPLEISIPEGLAVEPGLKRMRIVFDNFGNPSPCGTFYFGETEDYGVMVARNENTAALSTDLKEISADTKNNIKEVALSLANGGDAALDAELSVDYSLPVMYEPRTMAPVKEFVNTIKVRKGDRKIAKEADAETVQQVLRYDGGFDSGIALSNSEEAIFAHYYPANVIQSLKGMFLSSVDVYFSEVPENTTVKVYGQGDDERHAGALLAEQKFEAVEGWNTVMLDNPVKLDGNDLWFGVELKGMDPTAYYMGIDAISAAAGYGDLCNIGGNYWWSMSELGIDHNFCIRGNVTGERTAAINWISLDSSTLSIPSGENKNLNVTLNATDLENSVYEARIVISSNDELKSRVEIPVYLFNGIVTGIDKTTVRNAGVTVTDGCIRITSEMTIARAEAFDMTGMARASVSAMANEANIALDNFANGIYVINVTYVDGTSDSFKIAVAR